MKGSCSEDIRDSRNRLTRRDDCSFARMQKGYREILGDGQGEIWVREGYLEVDRIRGGQIVIVCGNLQLKTLSQRIRRRKYCKPRQPS